MLSETEKRAAVLAVSRYGADQARVRRLCRAVSLARDQGEAVDLLDILVRKRLLDRGQAGELRLHLDITNLDTTATNGTARKGDPNNTPYPNDKPLRILGGYRILRLLGEGGMGAVYLGYEPNTHQKVAVKILSEQLSGNQAVLDRFLREGRSGAILNHPNIVRNVSVGRDLITSVFYLVLEYVDGPSAQALLDQFGRLAVGDAVHIALDIARGLEHAHSRNIVHRDIKPANILITQTGIAKLSDLGLAKRMDVASHLTGVRQGFGTPYYMPYEQALNARKADARSDIFALGATLYHLVTGEVPFPGDNPVDIAERKSEGWFPPARSLDPNVPAVLDSILEKMMAREPGDRYQTASEAIVELERADLAAAVPSFVDFDLAMQDPLVRKRVVTTAQPTSPDLPPSEQTPPVTSEDHSGQWWYLRFRDRKGKLCKTRATTNQVLVRLRRGRMPGQIKASRHAGGKYRPLEEFPEFQMGPTKKAPSRKNGKPVERQQSLEAAKSPQWLVIGLSAGLVMVLAMLAATWAIFLNNP